jgi:hypothetical protein
VPLTRLHRAVDRLAVWLAERARGAPLTPPRPTWWPDPFGPLPPLPPPPGGAGPWRAPSPWPGAAPLEVEVVPADGPPRGVALLVPPWTAPGARLLAPWVRLLRGAGLETWVVSPPPRLAGGARSLAGLVAPGLAGLAEAVGQLTMELRLLSALARQRGGEATTVGLSLGALGAALCATAPEATPSVALVAPPLDLRAVLTRTPLGRRWRRLDSAAGAPLAEAGLAALLAPCDAGARRPVARRIFVATGRHDGLATPRGPLPLVRGWGVLPHAYARGHLTLLFACRQVRADLAAFLAAPERAPA